MAKYQFVATFECEDDFYDAVLDAFNSGNGWGRVDEYDGAFVLIYNYECDWRECFRREDLMVGMWKYMTGWATGCSKKNPLCFENGELDLAMIDSEIADCIVQFACFGDLIYG